MGSKRVRHDLVTEQQQIVDLHCYDHIFQMGFPGGVVVKNSPASAGNARDPGWISGSGKSLGGRNVSSLQNFCLENPWTEEPHILNLTQPSYLILDKNFNELESLPAGSYRIILH